MGEYFVEVGRLCRNGQATAEFVPSACHYAQANVDFCIAHPSFVFRQLRLGADPADLGDGIPAAPATIKITTWGMSSIHPSLVITL
jgi:hypothetical protein